MEATSGADEVLAEYRRRGGMAGLNQRLTVRADGRMELDDRRAGTRTTATASEAELASLREALGRIDEDSWSRWPRPRWGWLSPQPHDSLRVEVRRGGRRVAPSPDEKADVAALLAELDALLARAVRERRA